MDSVGRVASADGTSIAFERFGSGHPLILVGGALRSPVVTRPLAQQLAQVLTVFIYDRRGRGNSGDTLPYAAEREIEDLRALVAEAGGTASVYGHSSGVGVALRAAVGGLPITKLVLHDVPFAPDDDARTSAHELDKAIQACLAADRRNDAIELFLASVGLPAEAARQFSQDHALPAIAHTIPYDFEILRDTSEPGGSFVDQAAGVSVPALVLSSWTSPEWMTDMSRQIADALPNGRHLHLDGHEPIVTPAELAPVLTEFLATRPASTSQ
jgi:Alpha/beta hydrolase family